MEVPAFSFQSRWRRQGKRRNLHTKLYDNQAGKAGGGGNPGASARNRYASAFYLLELA